MLHYSADDGPVKAGDVVVMDVAGEYAMYASDITRTAPANGKFTERQREIYNVVLGAQQAVIQAFRAGTQQTWRARVGFADAGCLRLHQLARQGPARPPLGSTSFTA